MKNLILPLALLAVPLPVAAQGVSEFLVQQCNSRVGGNTWETSLRVFFPGREAIVHVVGEDGLTGSIAFDGPRAVQWARGVYPELTAGARGRYDDSCGLDEDENDT